MADALTGRKPGYLAAIDNTPPLIFRFQINPDIATEKRSYKWDEVQDVGSWKLEGGGNLVGSVVAAGVAGLFPAMGIFSGMDDIKKYSAALVNTRPLQAKQGDPRTFALDFALDATLASVLDEGDHYGGSIEPDLFVLRSFVNPSTDLISFGKWLASGFSLDKKPTGDPPLCSLYYAGLSVTCVMTDLGIKVTSFKEDGKPQRAEVSVTLKEQTLSFSPIVEFFQRNVNIVKSYNRKGFGTDLAEIVPLFNLFT